VGTYNLPLVAIVAAAGNAQAQRALEIHYRILMRTSQNIAVGMNVKGVFLCGDNQVSNDKFVKSIKQVRLSPLRSLLYFYILY
jgi:glucokinase